MSNLLFKTTELALADLYLHLIQYLCQLLLRYSKIISDFETDCTGKSSIL